LQLAAQHPELAKELLNRPLLAHPQSRGPVVPSISYVTPDSAAQDARSRNRRRAPRRGGARNDRSHSQSLSRPTRDSEEHSESQYRRGRLDLPAHLDPEPRPRYQSNTDNSSQTRRQDRSPGRAQAIPREPRYYDTDPSDRLLHTDEWRPPHGPWVSETQRQFSPQDESLSRVPSHATRYADGSDRCKADEWALSHDPWLSVTQRANASQGAREHQAISDEARHVDKPAVMSEWAHSHDPWVSGNQQQSGSHIQAIRRSVLDMTKNADTSTQPSNIDEWGPPHDPWASETVSTKSGGLPGSHSRVSHHAVSNTHAPRATDGQWQAPHDPWLTEPVIGDTTASKQPSFEQREYPAHIQSQPTASISSQPSRLKGRNSDLNYDTNGSDSYRVARKQQVAGINLTARRYLRNETESERRFSCAETGGSGQMGLGSAPPEEPRPVSSPPRIVACLDNEERPRKASGDHSVEWHKARPPTPAMVLTRSLNAGEVVQLDTSSPVNIGDLDSYDAFRDIHRRDNNVDLVSERNLRISRTMPVESHDLAPNSNLRSSHATTRSDVHWLKHNITRDATLGPLNPLHSNANDSLPSFPFASNSRNDSALNALQYSTRTSSNTSHKLHPSNIHSRAETNVHLQLGFDPRAEDWLANAGSRGRGQADGSYNSSLAHSRQSLPARAGTNSSAQVYDPRDIQQQSYERELIKGPTQLVEAHRYASNGMRSRGQSDGTSTMSAYN
jgi:hypothetical protein